MRLKKISRTSLSLILSLNIVLTNTSFIVKAEGGNERKVITSIENEKIVISNDYIKREFSINEGRISTTLIENNRANTKIVPQEGSEDFIINTIKDESEIPDSSKPILPTQVLERDNWNATLNVNDGRTYSEEDVLKLFDGNKDTYINNYQISGYPTSLKIDLGEEKSIGSFSYLKRPGYQDSAYGINGTMGKYKLYISDDGENWIEAGNGEFTRNDYNLHQEGNLYNVGNIVYANFNEVYETRYVRIDQLSDGLGSTQEYTAAEINLFSDMYKLPEVQTNDTKIKSSSLTIDTITTKVEDIQNGKKLTISYMPYTLNNIQYEIDMVVVLENDDHYMRSFIEVKTNNTSAKIDYIDIDHFVLSKDILSTVWSHPDLSNVSSMWIGKNELMLGQPIYVNGMFLGSEFPATDTDVVNNEIQIRYYSGKSFERLAQDNQLTTDGKFVSWQNVIGAAKGIDTDVVQTDFYEYIFEIATPTDFRKQYNSWYDNMMEISDDSIAKSFYGSEKGLTENGIEPVDSYVVDDGWNNYRDEEFNKNISGASSGNSINRTGFWEFNDKFPNELYTSKELVNKLQSNFGVWLGPQGGYNFFGGFAKYLEKMGTGYTQNDYWTNVCVGSDKYVKNLTSLFIDYQNRFDVDYWKIDGFAVRPCTNSNHDHMTGGTNNMYYTTDLWEKWIDAWEEMRENRAAEGKDLFINATCYVNLSPWILQWVNTVWVQDSGDTGEAGTGERHQRKITYRDNVYFNLLKKNQVQFPLKNIYNHDPIYGVSDGSSASTEDFRDFLFANAVRGTAFWELYYSPSIMDDEKWQVNADALDFAEKNAHILKNAKMFGNNPTQGVYGYSSWDGNEGIISFRNPTGEEQTYTLQLTDVIGVPKSIGNLRANQVLPFKAGEIGEVSYGDEVTVTLSPYETRIIQYGNTDTEEAKLLSAKVSNDNEITIKYNERVENVKEAYTIEGNVIKETKLLDDYRTIVIKTENILTESVSLNIDGEKDSLGNITKYSLTIPVYKDSKIAYIESSEDLINASDLSQKYNGIMNMFFMNVDKEYKVNTDKSFEGTTDFAINMAISTEKSGVDLFKQGDDIKLSISDEGYVSFKVKNEVVTSKSDVTTVVEKAYGTFGTDKYVPTSTETSVVGKINDGNLHQIVAVREVNGMLKIYIDGNLANSLYDSSKINESIDKQYISIGDNNFEGTIGKVEFRNSSIYYDEIMADYSLYEKEPITEYSREGWTATACSEMSGTIGDASASAAIDGNENSWWHTNYVGGDNHEGNHWISINFGEEISFDTVKLLQRGSASNGTIKKYKLEAKISGNWQTVKEGEFTDGTNSIIELEESIKATEIRITSLSTFNGQNFAAIKEIYVSEKDRLATNDEINNLIDSIKNIDEYNYTIATVNRYKKVTTKIKNLEVIYKKDLEILKNEMESAYNSLLESRELNELLAFVETLNKDNYTEESWNSFVEKFLKAKFIVENIEATKGDIEEATIELEKGINSLEKIKNEILITKDLEEEIKKAKNINEAILNNISKEVKEEFVKALDEAENILNLIAQDKKITQEEIDKSLDRLKKAIKAVENEQKPDDPEDTGKPNEPTNPVDPDDSVKPVDPVDPSKPIKPIEPVKPSKPVDPADPSNPANPNKPDKEDGLKENEELIDSNNTSENLPNTGGIPGSDIALIGTLTLLLGVYMVRKRKVN